MQEDGKELRALHRFRRVICSTVLRLVIGSASTMSHHRFDEGGAGAPGGARIPSKTAKALGLTIPPALLLRADQVIE